MPPASDAELAEPLLVCGNCRQAMQRLTFAGHYGQRVDLDLCRHCDWVWFDGIEAAQLSGGPALLELIGEMALSHALPHELLRADARCPRCDGRLGLVHNQSRWGHSSQLQCLRRHGAYQSFAQFLEEKGLLRAMSRLDRARLVRERGRIDCVNCGGSIGMDDERCPYCHSVASLLDVARLARALDPLDTIEPPAVYATGARQQALQCAACGAPLPNGDAIRCTHCGATLAIPSLAEANAAVQALAPALRAAAEHPAPAVVKRRLEALDGDLPRRRDFVQALEAESRQGRQSGWDVGDDGPWSWIPSTKADLLRGAVVVIAFAILWYWIDH